MEEEAAAVEDREKEEFVSLLGVAALSPPSSFH
jgi:hypothetical protein